MALYQRVRGVPRQLQLGPTLHIILHHHQHQTGINLFSDAKCEDPDTLLSAQLIWKADHLQSYEDESNNFPGQHFKAMI